MREMKNKHYFYANKSRSLFQRRVTWRHFATGFHRCHVYENEEKKTPFCADFLSLTLEQQKSSFELLLSTPVPFQVILIKGCRL